MLKRKLAALDHPNPNTFDVHDETEFRSTVLWLEDQKIRHYKIDEREGLRKINDQSWEKDFEQYQKNLTSPVIDKTHCEQLTWLASLAIRLEYGDNAVKYNTAAQELAQKLTTVPNVTSSNPLDNLDFSGADFSTGVSELAAMAKVGPHYDSRVRLGALATVLKTAPHPAMLSTHLECVEKPSDVMDLLFLSELRVLQTSINEALVAVQQITANPKTDTTLGQVGR